MAGGTKKKKKPANPARGFATTSVASKPKAETEAPSTTTTTLGVATPSEKTSFKTHSIEPASPAVAPTERELHELSPEELEAQLEASELQQFVEKHGAKVKKEVSRQVVRLQTDKRLLRGQSDYLSVRDWLPDELMQQILDLTLADLKNDVNSQKKTASPTGDDLVAKVWQLRQCLLDLAFPLERVNDVVGWVISSPPPQSSVGSLWGLEECLEWLALHCDVGELDDYDFERQRVIMDDGDEAEEAVEQASQNWKAAKMLDTSLPETVDGQDNGFNEENPIDVSDVESDMEPDELLSVYLRTKARLYELNPDVDASAVGKKKSSKQSKAPAKRSSGERKMEQKLQKIENDVLFDKREADAHWAAHKISLMRDTAERRRLQIHDNHDPTPARSSVASTPPSGVSDEAERLGQELLAATDAAEDDDLLSGMFDALPGVSDSAVGGSPSEGAVEGVTIRDFGRLVGMNPKRVLEEACKARDAKCKQAYRMISPTTYASRHSVTIQWTKQQDCFEHVFLPAVIVQYRPLKTVVTMVQTATPDTAQSEAFVATAALFLIFSGSPKEEKVHLRLPAAFRDLWDEFTRAKAEHAQAEECATVKEVRALIDRHYSADDEDDDEVVFNVNTRRRLDGMSGSSTPVKSETRRMQQPEVIEELQQMWARKTSTPAYQRMLVGRMNLPMYHFRETALDTIQRHQVTILCGETGCGKSTQLPAFILENELANGRPCKIYCTEPRRISAISLAQRVSEEMGENKGDVGTFRSLVGYAIRLESQTTAQTRLVYATVGIVLRMLENSNGLNDITHLILDEVHERSIDTDFLLIVLRSLMLKRPDLKVVLMSATVNAQRFSQYLDGAPIIDVPGRTFPVEAKFLEDAIELTGHTNEDAATAAIDEDNNEEDAQEKGTSDQQLNGYSKKTRNTLATYDEYRIDYSLIVKLIEKIGHHAQYQDYSKAILVFLPGLAEIRQVNDMLCGHPRFSKGWRVFPLHSTFSSEDQQAAFEIPPPGVRKIVLATNIAETGITIPDVTCVIDTGKHKEMRFDERRQMSRLIQSFIARANAKQRRGRAGRVQQGLCFHLFTRYRHDHIMVDAQTPEMLRLSLQDLVMRVKICKLGDIEHALSQALDPPSSRNIRRAIDALVEVGALTTGEDLTPLGNQLAKLPLDAQLGKLILLGSNFGCLDFALTAAATLSSKTPFLSPMHQKKQADTVRLGFKRGDSDLLTAYNAYTTWRKICTTPHMSEFQFCNKNFLSSQNLGNVEDLKAQLLSSLIDAGFVHLGPDERTALNRMRHNTRNRNFVMLPPQYTRSDENDVLASSVVAWSFYPKIVKQDGKGWRNISNNQSLGLHPTSVNKTTLNPDVKFLSFYSIMQSSSRFTNAQETSPVAEIPLLMMCGEAVFHMYAGVVVVDGNRLRLKVRDWRTMVVLKLLRAKSKEVMAKLFRNPGRELGDRPRRWMEILEKIFEKQGVKAAATRT